MVQIQALMLSQTLKAFRTTQHTDKYSRPKPLLRCTPSYIQQDSKERQLTVLVTAAPQADLQAFFSFIGF